MEVSPTIAKDFHALADLMISLNHSRRRSIDPVIEKSLGASNYLREFCTVHLNIGRCTGKTSFITSRATPEDAIITHNMATADYLRKQDNVWAKIFTAQSFTRYNDNLRGRILYEYSLEAVYVDEPKYTFKMENSLDRFYQECAILGVHTIVMVGE